MAKKHNRLYGRIVEKFGTIEKFAKQVGMTRIWVGAKINGSANFTARDIRVWGEILDIKPDEIGAYFFE